MSYIHFESDVISLQVYVFGYCVEIYITSFRLYVFFNNNDLNIPVNIWETDIFKNKSSKLNESKVIHLNVWCYIKILHNCSIL